MSMMTDSQKIVNRAKGSVLASAAGDALGAPYEFGVPLPAGRKIMQQATHMWGLSEWTDDTSMGYPILVEAAAGADLTDFEVQGRIFRAWMDWALEAKDIGTQTSAIVRSVRGKVFPAHSGEWVTERARTVSQNFHERSGRSAGNGSLMRTGAIALRYVHGHEDDAATAAREISELTHWDEDAGDACVLWTVAIRHAILTGDLDLTKGFFYLPEDRRALWAERIAEAQTKEPWDFDNPGWVVHAFQASASALRGANTREQIERAVRSGYDADTVAAITGSLAGAIHGARAIPEEWTRDLHGYPGVRGSDLTALASQAVSIVKN